ncbi:hypothetical protein ACN28S_05375 [Cystobacter fuscus]
MSSATSRTTRQGESRKRGASRARRWMATPTVVWKNCAMKA